MALDLPTRPGASPTCGACAASDDVFFARKAHGLHDLRTAAALKAWSKFRTPSGRTLHSDDCPMANDAPFGVWM
jgi:hypothetical protein